MDDEKIYNAILDELREHGPRQGLWAKCFTEANGDENAAKALYFKYRTEQLVAEASSAPLESNSTELAISDTSNEIIKSADKKFNYIALIAFVLCIVFGFSAWFAENRKAEIRKVEGSQEMEKTIERMAAAAARYKEESEKKELFNNLHATLPDFNFDKERQNCRNISSALSQADYRSCVLDLLEVSNTRINDLKNKFILASNETSGNDQVSYAFRKHNEIQSTWCDTFIDLTWGQGNGVVTGVANCKITLNALLGKTLRTIAANYSNSNLMSASFSKNLSSNTRVVCNDENCLKKIQLKITDYELKIETYLNSKKLLEKYENLSESSRLLWSQSLQKTVINSLILSDHICKNIAALNQSKQLLHNSTECEISFALFWLDELSSQYENFLEK